MPFQVLMLGKLPSPRNPLAVIAILIGAVEAILGGTALGIGSGRLQTFLVISMVIIFAGVTVAFFYVLIKYPGHFYNPAEFPKGILPFSAKERDMPRVDTRGEPHIGPSVTDTFDPPPRPPKKEK